HPRVSSLGRRPKTYHLTGSFLLADRWRDFDAFAFTGLPSAAFAATGSAASSSTAGAAASAGEPCTSAGATAGAGAGAGAATRGGSELTPGRRNASVMPPATPSTTAPATIIERNRRRGGSVNASCTPTASWDTRGACACA